MNGSDHGGRTGGASSTTAAGDETLLALSTTVPSEDGVVSTEAAAVPTTPEEPTTPATPPPQQPQQQPPAHRPPPPSRRSARVLDRDPVVAPGFGTRKDVQRLSQQLSTHTPFPPEAVLELMSTRGRGLRSSSQQQDADNSKGDGSGASGKKAATGGDASSASLWADFMNEEGVAAARGGSAAKAGGSDTAPPSSSFNKRVSSSDAAVNSGSAQSKKPASTSNKRQKASNATGLLVQTGTLDWTMVGRGSLKKGTAVPAHHLTVPTVLLPSVQIARVFTAGHAVHSIALDGNGVPYGWGRNESHQLGSHFPANVAGPTRLFDGLPSSATIPSSPIVAAAMGKGHTLLLTKEGKVWAVGANKAGQCSVVKAGDSLPNWKACTVPDNVTIAQVRGVRCTVR